MRDPNRAHDPKARNVGEMTMTKTGRIDVYTRVTEAIIADLEHGVRPWVKPWSAGSPATRIILPVRYNDEPYRGINVLLLWSEAIDKGYQSAKWMTYRQAAELGGYVRRGESGCHVVYANTIRTKLIDDDGSADQRDVYLMRTYMVFNTDQIDGLPVQLPDHEELTRAKPFLIDAAERFFDATGATIRHGGNEAYYTEGADLIRLPHPEAFKDAESYASTKAHELTHWTKHRSRLNRDFGRKHFGDDGYSREELVAELGAAYLCATLGITLQPREDHAAYMGHWLNVLKGDNRAIFSAAAHAQRAVDFLHGSDPTFVCHEPAGAGESIA
jgi:antirestriction protein ArdC